MSVKKIDCKKILSFGYPKIYLDLFRKLNTPQKIQNFLINNLSYNDFDTYRSFSGVLKTKSAHCFEGAVGFAYPLMFLHGYNPQIVIINADNEIDVDHTLVVYNLCNKFGSLAMSTKEHLMDRPPVFDNLFEMISTYYPYYESDHTEHKGELTMIGFSDPIDLEKKFGTSWFFLEGDKALEEIYYHLTDDVFCTPIFENKRYLYPPESKPN